MAGGTLLVLPLLSCTCAGPPWPFARSRVSLIWERLAASAESTNRRLRRPAASVLLALQAIALCALVFALAGPQRDAGAPEPTTVYVVDGSLWMHVGTRLADARADVLRQVAAQPGRVAVIAATSTPRLSIAEAAPGWEGRWIACERAPARATWPRAWRWVRVC